jgi:hypothetical protein
MIQSLLQRRPVLMGLSLAMLFVLIQARPITNLLLASLKMGWGAKAIASMPAAMPQIKKALSPMPRSKAKVSVDFNGLPLRSTARDYRVHLSGQVAGNEALRATELELTLLTDRNTEIHRLVAVQPNGSFDLQIPLTEYQQAQMDWHLVARRGGVVVTEARGRRILTTESDVDVEAPLALQ